RVERRLLLGQLRRLLGDQLLLGLDRRALLVDLLLELRDGRLRRGLLLGGRRGGRLRVERDRRDEEAGRGGGGADHVSEVCRPLARSRTNDGATPSQSTTATAIMSTVANAGDTGTGAAASSSDSLNHMVMMTPR